MTSIAVSPDAQQALKKKVAAPANFNGFDPNDPTNFPDGAGPGLPQQQAGALAQAPPLTQTAQTGPSTPMIPAVGSMAPIPGAPPAAAAIPGAPPAPTPPGGYGTNTAAPQANGDPAGPPGIFDAFNKQKADALAITSAPGYTGQPAPGAAPQYRDMSTGQDVSAEAGKASLHAQNVADATAQLTPVIKPGGLVTTDTFDPKTTDYGAANPTTSTQSLIDAIVARGESPNGGANPDAFTPDDPRYITPHAGPTNNSGGSGYLDASGKLVIPDGTNTPWDATQDPHATSSGFPAGTRPALPGGAASGTIPAVGGSTSGISASSNPNPNAVTTFDQGNDLRDKQINPTNNARTDALGGLVSDAASAVGKGASRGDISKGYLDAFDQAAQPKIRDQIRAVGQQAAKFGRLGAGDTAVEALNPYTDYLTQRSAYAKQLAGDSAAGDISDRLNNLGALNSTQGQAYNQDASGRGELRTERGYQENLNQTAIQNALQQFITQQQAQGQQFNQNATTAQFGLNAANAASGNAGLDFNALAELLGPYLKPKTP